MTYTAQANGFHLGLPAGTAIAGAGLAGLRGVGAERGLADAVDIGPLLDGLIKVGVAQGSVGGAVPELHAGACACVTRVSIAHCIAPLLRCTADGAVGAVAVPGAAVSSGKAAKGHAGKGGTGFKYIRIQAE